MEGRNAVRMTTSLFASRKDTAPQSPGSTNGSAEETSLAEVTGVTNNAVRLLKSERPSCTLCKFWQMVKDLAVAATENGAVQRQISGHLEEKKRGRRGCDVKQTKIESQCPLPQRYNWYASANQETESCKLSL